MEKKMIGWDEILHKDIQKYCYPVLERNRCLGTICEGGYSGILSYVIT